MQAAERLIELWAKHDRDLPDRARRLLERLDDPYTRQVAPILFLAHASRYPVLEPFVPVLHALKEEA